MVQYFSMSIQHKSKAIQIFRCEDWISAHKKCHLISFHCLLWFFHSIFYRICLFIVNYRLMLKGIPSVKRLSMNKKLYNFFYSFVISIFSFFFQLNKPNLSLPPIEWTHFTSVSYDNCVPRDSFCLSYSIIIHCYRWFCACVATNKTKFMNNKHILLTQFNHKWTQYALIRSSFVKWILKFVSVLLN